MSRYDPTKEAGPNGQLNDFWTDAQNALNTASGVAQGAGQIINSFDQPETGSGQMTQYEQPEVMPEADTYGQAQPETNPNPMPEEPSWIKRNKWYLAGGAAAAALATYAAVKFSK